MFLACPPGAMGRKYEASMNLCRWPPAALWRSGDALGVDGGTLLGREAGDLGKVCAAEASALRYGIEGRPRVQSGFLGGAQEHAPPAPPEGLPSAIAMASRSRRCPKKQWRARPLADLGRL